MLSAEGHHRDGEEETSKRRQFVHDILLEPPMWPGGNYEAFHFPFSDSAQNVMLSPPQRRGERGDFAEKKRARRALCVPSAFSAPLRWRNLKRLAALLFVRFTIRRRTIFRSAYVVQRIVCICVRRRRRGNRT